jgi:hypothetical protein
MTAHLQYFNRCRTLSEGRHSLSQVEVKFAVCVYRVLEAMSSAVHFTAMMT